MKNFLSLLFFLGIFLPAGHAARFYVNAATGNDANTGTSWAQSFKTFQKAIEVANNNDEIWLTGGTYRPTKDFSGQSYPNTLKLFLGFYISKAFQVYGRFVGTETTAAQRNPNNPPTILSADIDGDDLANPAQSPADFQGTNGSRLLYMTNLPNNGIVRLDDLTITGADGEAGLILVGGGNNITVTKCHFTGNSGAYNNQGAAGATFIGSSGTTCYPKITNSSFDHNTNAGGPGGCFIWAATGPCNADFTNCTFQDNSGEYGGGLGIFAANTEPCTVNIMGSTFSNNVAISGGNGGGITCSNATLHCNSSTINNNQAYLGAGFSASEVLGNNEVVFTNCDILQNQAGSGGGMYLVSANTSLINTRVEANTAQTYDGGGIFIESYFVPLPTSFHATGSTFLLNTAAQQGGGICNRDPLATLGIDHSNFRGNTAANGGAYYQDFADNSSIDTKIESCIFSENTATSGNGGAINVSQAAGSTHANGLGVNFSTFYKNESSSAGAQVFADGTLFNGSHLIFWGSVSAPAVGEFAAVNAGTVALSYSLLQSADCAASGATTCSRNLYNRDPMFINTGVSLNLGLQMCSPAVNTGAYSPSTLTDYAGNARPYNDGTGALDMGAYEYQGTPPNTFYRDMDYDGYGIATSFIKACNALPGFAALAGDCQDNDPTVNPGAAEICDGRDNNCNNLTDYLDPTLVDPEPPTFQNAPVDLQLACTDLVPAPAPVTATDNCTPNPVLTFVETTTRSGNSADCAYYTYTITRTWTAKDSKNNVATLKQVITVKDDQAPVFSVVSPDVTVNCDQAIPGYIPPSATDNCSAVSINLQTTTDRSNDPNECAYYSYTITRTWTAQDRCGNTATARQVISVQDNKAPFVPFPPDQQVIVECDQAVPQVSFLASQDCDAHPVLTVTETSEEFDADPFDHVFGRITRHITLTDHCGNATSFTQILKIRDNLPPVITKCPADITVTGGQNGAMVNVPQPEIKDNCGYTAYYTPYEPGDVQFPVGVTQMYIDVYDRGGNSTECAFKVTVQDDFKVHCQDPIFATILNGTTPDNNAVRWNPPFAEACAFCDQQQLDPQFQQRFKPLGNLQGHRYFLSNQKLSPAAAASLCAQYGGYLATPGTALENRMLSNELTGQPALIGLSDAASEGQFAWADGQPLTYQHWAPGQPNNGPAAAGLDYATIALNGQWQNVGADSALFILELPCYNLRVTATNFPASNLAPVGSYEVKYQVQDYCGRTEDCLQTIAIARDRKAYCQPNLYPDAIDRDTSLWIQKVQIGTFTQKSGNNYGSARYVSNPNVTLTAGQAVPITVTLGASNGNGKAYVHVWFDANADRDFYDAGEVLLDTFITGGQVTFAALIPAGAAVGDARQRIRVAVSRYYAPEACGDYTTGETEDYRVAVKATTINFKNEPASDRATETASAWLFPNPATTEAFLNLSDYAGARCTVRLVDLQGRNVQSLQVDNTDDALIRLDLSGLAPGLYLVQTQAEGQALRTDKLIIAE